MNIANVVTVLRIAVVPFFAWALLVDGVTTLLDVQGVAVGDLVEAVVVASDGVDLVAERVR